MNPKADNVSMINRTAHIKAIRGSSLDETNQDILKETGDINFIRKKRKDVDEIDEWL